MRFYKFAWIQTESILCRSRLASRRILEFLGNPKVLKVCADAERLVHKYMEFYTY